MKPASDVAVALSGGVDSAMAAVLLKREGWKVYGLHFVLSSVDPRREGRVKEIATRIGIPLEIIDLRERFETLVVTPFCDAYLEGLTPNPCVRCNQEIKFEALYRHCIEKGIHSLATGHYVRMDLRDGRPSLRRGVDTLKDQSYFLQRLGQDPLSMALFPLGEMTKGEIRRRARNMDLSCHSKPESQEICFISGMDYREFIEKRRGNTVRKRGLIVNIDDEPVGDHEGVYRYTVGQRHGLRIASSRPYYVKEIRPDANQVVVARREALFTAVVEAQDVRWIEGPPKTARMLAQVRYRHRAAPGRLVLVSSNKARFVFDAPQWAVTPGQALALYDGESLIGGGWITRSLD
jgi:tRNA-uridine 2-sulfurtransferase